MRLTIRISPNSLAFAAREADGTIAFEPYHTKSGVSIAANLRQAFSESRLLGAGYKSALAVVDSPVLLLPIEEYSQDAVPTLYAHAFTTGKENVVLHSVLPDQNAVAAFTINRDLRMVLDDNFNDVAVMPMMQPVWACLYHRSFTGTRRKMFVYIHNKVAEVFAFRQNRFCFSNRFDAARAADAAYYVLYAWQQLGYNNANDELHIVGDCMEQGKFAPLMREYLANVYEVSPAACFGDSPVVQVKGMPFDLQAFYAKGR